MHRGRWSWGIAGILALGMGVAAAGAYSAPMMPNVLKDSTPTPYHRVEGFASTLPKVSLPETLSGPDSQWKVESSHDHGQ